VRQFAVSKAVTNRLWLIHKVLIAAYLCYATACVVRLRLLSCRPTSVVLGFRLLTFCSTIAVGITAISGGTVKKKLLFLAIAGLCLGTFASADSFSYFNSGLQQTRPMSLTGVSFRVK
jgi:hypothetical protein